MVVVMQEAATEDQIQHVISKLMEMGFDIHRSTGARHTVLGAVGAVVDGGTRDSGMVISMGFPLFARYRTPIEIGRAHV
jgi:hypothetical protein